MTRVEDGKWRGGEGIDGDGRAEIDKVALHPGRPS